MTCTGRASTKNLKRMKKNKNEYAVIMAGVVGSRFWPLSKKSYPKQFHDILGVGKSLLRMTYERFEKFIPKENIYIITNASYELLVADQIPELSENQIIGEPAAMNTAPCVAYSTFKIFAHNPDAKVIFAPSDHQVTDSAAFEKSIRLGLDHLTDHNVLITLGITPDRPDTGYGYIQYLESASPIKKVKTFTEKPSLEIAITFLESGEFVWNSGIFIWNARDILDEFKTHQPEIYEIFQSGMDLYNTGAEEKFIARQYPLCKSISIDFAIMEKTSKAMIIPASFGWSDLGTWKSLYDLRSKDKNGNVVQSKGILYNTSGSVVIQENSSEKLIIIDGLKDAMVIDTPDILFISSLDKEQEVRQIVNDVREKFKGKYT
jgi:mannose-1-phosphate guanylyltransferase